MNFFKKYIHHIIWLLVTYNLVSIIFMVSGYWPEWVTWVNLVLSIIFILFVDSYYSVLLLIALIPFYTVVPNRYSDTLTQWRILFAGAFVIWAAKDIYRNGWKIWQHIKTFSWDWALLALAVWTVILLPLTHYRSASLKQLIFFVNIYLLYILAAQVITSGKRMKRVIQYAAASVGIIVLLGYIQLALTFILSLDDFWHSWALMASSLYYGNGLAGVLLYSNSWFAYTGGESLRMFSILPDSHAFALVAVFAVAFILPLTYYFYHDATVLKVKVNYWLWYAVRFAGLAIILSGTRAVWVGMVGPLAFIFWLYRKKLKHAIAKKTLTSFAIIIVFFALSPLINSGLNYVRVSKFQENFVARAKSIYDLEEVSNVGRIQIWQQSLVFYVHHPLGVGLGNFIVSLNPGSSQQNYQAAAQQHNTQFNLPQKYVTAHSLYLQFLVELGIVGLLLFGWFCFSYLLHVERFMRQHFEDNNVFVFFVVEAAMVVLWILVAGFFDVTLFNDRVLMYFFLTLALSGLIMSNYEQYLVDAEAGERTESLPDQAQT